MPKSDWRFLKNCKVGVQMWILVFMGERKPVWKKSVGKDMGWRRGGRRFFYRTEIFESRQRDSMHGFFFARVFSPGVLE